MVDDRVPGLRDPGLSKDQVFETLRREILAARLKVTLDEQLHRKTSPTVKRLAKMKLPPVRRSYNLFDDGNNTRGVHVSDQFPPMR